MIRTQLRRYLPLALFVLAIFALHATGFAEEAADAGKEGPEQATIWSTIKDGGPLIMFIWVCIIGTSVAMVTLVVQNAMTLRKDKLAPPPLIQALQQTISAGNYQEAWATCNANKGSTIRRRRSVRMACRVASDGRRVPRTILLCP